MSYILSLLTYIISAGHFSTAVPNGPGDFLSYKHPACK